MTRDCATRARSPALTAPLSWLSDRSPPALRQQDELSSSFVRRRAGSGTRCAITFYTTRRASSYALDRTLVESPVIQACALCLHNKPLRKSHLIPQAVYGLLHSDETANPNPVTLRPGQSIQSSKQLRRPLLCAECEQRFSTRGETTALRMCARQGDAFRLRDDLLETTPLESSETGQAYDMRNLTFDPSEALTYFALSMCWRSAVTHWNIGAHRVSRVELGPYIENVRAYLLGEAPFPPHTYALLYFFTEPTLQRVVAIPFSTRIASGCWRHNVTVPGITVSIFIGQHVQEALVRNALNTPGPRLALTGSENQLPHLRALGAMLRTQPDKR